MKLFLWLLGCAIATALGALVLRATDVHAVAAALQTMDAAWLLVALLCNGAVLLLWACMWRMLLPRGQQVHFGRLVECAAYSAFASNATPLAGGQLTSTALLAQRAGVGMTAAVSITALEMLAEGMVKLAVIALAMTIAPLPSWMRNAFYGLAAVVSLLAVILLVLSRLGARSSGLVARFAGSLDAMRDPRRLLAGAAFIAAMKLAEALAILCVQRGFGVNLPLSTLPLVLSVVMLATMVPVVPGNFGTYEAAAFLVYQQLGVPAGMAAALALVQHLALLTAFAGASAIALIRAYPRLVAARIGVATALFIWISLLALAVCIGVLALWRGFTGAKEWKGIRSAPQLAGALRRQE